MNNPFDWFDGIFVINLDFSIARWIRFMKIANEYGFAHKVYRIQAVKHEIGSFGCALSHKKALERAKRMKLNNVLIFEDDVEFLYDVKYTHECLNSGIENLKNMKWDIFYLGVNPAVRDKDIREKNIKGFRSTFVPKQGKVFHPCFQFYGRFGLCFNKSMFDVYKKLSSKVELFKPELRGDMIIKSTKCSKVLIWPMLIGVDDSPSLTGVGLDNINECRRKDNHNKILRCYDKLGLVDKK